MNLQIFTKWYAKYVLFALCCIILLVVPLLKGPWIGSEPLLYFRLAQDPSWYDSLNAGGQFAAYQWGNALVLHAAPEILIQILPFILGILSFLLLGKILHSFSEDPIFVNLSLLLFILSPTFIYTFSFMNSLFIAFFLSLSSFYFYTCKKRRWLSIPIAMLIPLFNIVLACAFLFVLFFYTFFGKKERKKLFFLLLLGTLFVSAIYYGYILFYTGIPQQLTLEAEGQFQFFQKIFFDLGSTYGLGIFMSILACLGIASLWDKKYANPFFFLSITFLLFFSLIKPESLIFLSLFLVLFAAKGLLSLLAMRWTSKQYKHFFIFIVISGLIFSSISQMNHLIEAAPDDAILEGLHFLSEQKGGVVFTDYSRGVWIEVSEHATVLDENYLFVPDAEQRLTDSKELYFSRDLERTEELFQKYDVSYVWIDSEMKKEIWKYDTEGLLFILQYTKDFKMIYNKDGVEIWSIEQ